MRIPITMCHGTNPERQPALDVEQFAGYIRIAAELGFQSISYDDLAAWRDDGATLPERPMMFDFDHPAWSIRHELHPIMADYGYRGNLFINTGWLEALYRAGVPDAGERSCMTWEEIGDLIDAGWHIGAHTHSHPNLSELGMQDPSGTLIRAELEQCDGILQQQLGIIPRDFAFTSTTWSQVAEKEVKARYRFGRLWIIGTHYDVDGGRIRYADLVGVPGADEADGGPPVAARYITRTSDPYRLPSMELEYLLYDHGAFRAYLEGALPVDT